MVEAGLWIVGHANIDRSIIELAGSYGFEVPKDVMTLMDGLPSITMEELEYIFDVVDEAENWLQENVAPEGYSFGWSDGDFYLLSDSNWQDMWGE